MNALVLVVLASTAAPDRVVVFPDRAQVTRTTPLTCGARVPVNFENIPPSATLDSFRARVTGGSVDGMRAELVKKEKEFSPKAEGLVKALEALMLEIENTSDQMSRAQTQTKVGRQYTEIAVQLVSREMATERPDLKSWQAAFDASLGSEPGGGEADLGHQREAARAAPQGRGAAPRSWTRCVWRRTASRGRWRCSPRAPRGRRRSCR